MSDKLEKLLAFRYSCSARKIQLFRRLKKRNAKALVIQKNYRKFFSVRNFKRFRTSALAIQSTVRGMLAAKRYRLVKMGVLRLQATVRRRLATRLTTELRNPYNRMSYSDLLAKIAETYTELTISFQNNDFVACEKRQECICEMKCSLSKKPLPEYTPSCRAEFDLFLLESNLRLTAAMAAEDFHLCADLQARVKRIEDMSSSFPTVEELDLELVSLKCRLDAAMQDKDFKACNECQQKLTKLETKKNEVMASFPISKLSLQDLIDKKTKVEKEIVEVLEKKDFHKCAALQDKVCLYGEEIERRNIEEGDLFERLAGLEKFREQAVLHGDFLRQAEIVISIQGAQKLKKPSRLQSQASWTYESLQALICQTKEEMQELLQKNDFLKCSVLQGEIDEMTLELSKLNPLEADSLHIAAAETAAVVIRRSRGDVEADIATKKQELERALKARDFKQCDQIHLAVIGLEAELEKLPSASMILATITELETLLDAHVNERNFAKCDGIEEELKLLRPKYDELREQEHRSAPVSSYHFNTLLCDGDMADKKNNLGPSPVTVTDTFVQGLTGQSGPGTSTSDRVPLRKPSGVAVVPSDKSSSRDHRPVRSPHASSSDTPSQQ